ncbi:cell division suppressor protein YneA [Pseudobutyrivibrio sp.]|uniref:cell division suppressor protein YneA n=1 Tax=Pseudobutyrivibrio sp. TaxID=2014367 RepID=UPI001E032120|nr:LysM peptidoglycan-binding domain-containing protein [Pseudobutyrivibrio sp.]MBE5909644.1 LysM peptidoglycan-binding domain-containing protein [Pseudobutyrivibrio sp.]
MRTNRRNKNIVRNRILLLTGSIICLLFSFIIFSNIADAEDSREVYTYYTSYEIQPGDTLWSIADQYMGPDYIDKEEFIENIKELNHMSTDSITAGKHLVIQYSSYEAL